MIIRTPESILIEKPLSFYLFFYLSVFRTKHKLMFILRALHVLGDSFAPNSIFHRDKGFYSMHSKTIEEKRLKGKINLKYLLFSNSGHADQWTEAQLALRKTTKFGDVNSFTMGWNRHGVTYMRGSRKYFPGGGGATVIWVCWGGGRYEANFW